MKRWQVGLVRALVLLLPLTVARADEAPCVSVSVGSSTAAGGSVVNVGQVVIGEAASASVTMQAGVIYCFAGSALLGDCDSDGDVDLVDFLNWDTCMQGPGQPYGGVPEDCSCIDMDGDNDLDLQDFQLFQSNLTS